MFACTAASAWQVNQAPVVILPSPLPVTSPGTVVDVGASVSDPDAGSADVELSFEISDAAGVFAPADVGRVTWDFGLLVTSDVATASLAEINAALDGRRFRPSAGFAGTAVMLMTIDDLGHTGTGGAKTNTKQFAIKVCSATELGNAAACAMNNRPVNGSLSPAPDTQPQTVVAVPWSVSDPDVGAGTLDMEINVADPSAVLTPAQVGTVSWTFGTAVTSDLATAALGPVNAALAGLSFRPAAGFAGQARLVFEIDDNGNSGTGGELSDTDFILIDVCTPAELGTAACAVNNNPVNAIPVGLSTPSETPLAIPASVSDPDVGIGLMEMELSLVDAAGVLTPAQVGTLSWSFGSGITSDVVIASRATINAALAGLQFVPAPTFTGTARIVFEIDDQGNSGSGGQLADTDFRDIPVTPRPGVAEIQSSCVRAAGEGTVVSIPVKRTSGDDTAVSVGVSLAGVTATPGTDFSLLSSSTLSWANQDRSDRVISLLIAADVISEPVESFIVNLVSPVGMALGGPASITIRIDPALTDDTVFLQACVESVSCP